MAAANITVTLKVAPWVRWYIQSVALFAQMTGMEPDVEKIVATCMRGVKVSHPVRRAP